MIPPLRSFDDVDGKERGQKKTDDLRAMTALGPRTLPACTSINKACERWILTFKDQLNGP